MKEKRINNHYRFHVFLFKAIRRDLMKALRKKGPALYADPGAAIFHHDNAPSHLRNKFHFSVVHQSMDAVGLVQSKCFPLHFDEQQKYEIYILYLYVVFLHRFCSIFVKFG